MPTSHTHKLHFNSEDFSRKVQLIPKHLLSPVGELHHQIQDRDKHEKVEERITVRDTFFFIVHTCHPPFALVFVISSLARITIIILVIWKTITAQERSLDTAVSIKAENEIPKRKRTEWGERRRERH